MRDDLWYLDTETLEAIDRLKGEAVWLVIGFDGDPVPVDIPPEEDWPLKFHLN